MNKTKKNISAVDLFCGIGRIPYGLKNVGINVNAGIDIDESCRYSFETNCKTKFIKKGIQEIEGKDPSYNSRRCGRFYHVLETLTKRDKPKLHDVVKPEPENIGDYCRVSAKDRFAELLNNINARYLVAFYSNTYDSKSNSSQNKITLKDVDFGDKLWQTKQICSVSRQA